MSYEMKMVIAWFILGLITVALVYFIIDAQVEYKRAKEAAKRLQEFKKRHGIY